MQLPRQIAPCCRHTRKNQRSIGRQTRRRNATVWAGRASGGPRPCFTPQPTLRGRIERNPGGRGHSQLAVLPETAAQRRERSDLQHLHRRAPTRAAPPGASAELHPKQTTIVTFISPGTACECARLPSQTALVVHTCLLNGMLRHVCACSRVLGRRATHKAPCCTPSHFIHETDGAQNGAHPPTHTGPHGFRQQVRTVGATRACRHAEVQVHHHDIVPPGQRAAGSNACQGTVPLHRGGCSRKRRTLVALHRKRHTPESVE